MTYTHAVKANGKFYPAGAEVPEKTKKAAAKPKQKQTSSVAKQPKSTTTEEA